VTVAGRVAAELVQGLAGRGLTLAVAESLTGGLVTAAVVEVPGASTVLRGGVVAYATELKHELLGVDSALLAEHGPIHPQVAAMMAAGVRERCGADIGVATTGVAGPEGQDGHSAGEVYIAVVIAGRSEERGLLLSGERDAVREAATIAALNLVIEVAGLSRASTSPGVPG